MLRLLTKLPCPDLDKISEDLEEVKKEMLTKEDLNKLEDNVKKRLKTSADVADNNSERIGKLEALYVSA